jgi:ABC-2 type transport system permease protein
VYLLTAYGSIAAFFLLGAALIAVGVFISSLTDNQGFAAGIGIAIILFNYYSVSLAEYISTSAKGTMIALWVIGILLGVVIHLLTKNDNLAYGVTFVIVAASAILNFAKPELLEGILPEVTSALSLFEKFYTFVNGVFDVTAIVYYLTVIVFFLFLSVQSLEKRRYN